MRFAEIEEAVSQIWSRTGSKSTRKYRCTSGPRKGRIVAKASTCNAPKKLATSHKMKITRRAKGAQQKIATRRTKKYNPASQRRLKRLNAPKRRRIAKRKKI